MLKLHFGCGGYHLEGWENHDLDVDLRQRLPYPDGVADFIFTEHVVEHLFQREAWAYFEECRRILRPGGVVRTTVPDIARVRKLMTPDYTGFVKQQGWGDGTPLSGIKHLVFNHGHQSMWTPDLMMSILDLMGFKAYQVELYGSQYPELRGLESHWKSIGKENNDIESISIEAVKPAQ